MDPRLFEGLVRDIIKNVPLQYISVSVGENFSTWPRTRIGDTVDGRPSLCNRLKDHGLVESNKTIAAVLGIGTV